MDILRTDSPVTGFEFPSSSLTRPSPYWVRALPQQTPVPEYTEDFDELEWEAEAELHSLVHQLSFSDMRDCKRVSSSSSFQSRASSSSSADSLSTIGYTSYTTSTSTLHTPSSSVDYQYSTRSIAKSRSFASLSLAPSARREAVYIIDDDETEQSDDADHYRTADALSEEPPSRFSIDEDVQSRPFRDIWTRSRAISMSSPRPSIPSSPALSAYPFPSMPVSPPTRSYAPAPPPSPTAHKKSKRKTVLSILNMGMFNF